MGKELITTNQDVKLALSKARGLMDITKKLLQNSKSKELIQSFDIKPFVSTGHKESVNSVSITPDSKYIVSGSKD